MLTASISDTAFMVNEARSRLEKESGDIYAGLWIPSDQTAKVKQLADIQKDKVFKHDGIELAVRCRHFLEELELFTSLNPNCCLLSLAAGLSSYPYLLANYVQTVEVDLKHIIDFKKARAKKLVESNKLPSREIRRMACDLEDNKSRAIMWESIKAALKPQTLFVVLLEGISYYLSDTTLNEIISEVVSNTPKGSLILLDYWPPSMKDSPVFKRMCNFFGEEFGQSNFSYHTPNSFSKIQGINLLRSQTSIDEEKRLLGSTFLSEPDSIFPEDYLTFETS